MTTEQEEQVLAAAEPAIMKAIEQATVRARGIPESLDRAGAPSWLARLAAELYVAGWNACVEAAEKAPKGSNK